MLKERHSHECRTTGTIEYKVKVKCLCAAGSCVAECCCSVAIHGPELPTGARGLLQTATYYKRVSTFCNRKCDHGVHPATENRKKCFGG